MLNALVFPKTHFTVFTKVSFFLLLALALYTLSLQHYLHFHTLIELLSVGMAIMIVLTAVSLKKDVPKSRRFYALLASLYLWVSLFDFAHLLTFDGMPLAEGLGTGPTVQFWIAGRLLEAFGLVVTLNLGRRHKWRRWEPKALALVAFCLLLTIFPLRIFPEAYRDDTGLTDFKIAAEYVVMLLMLITLTGVYRHRKTYSHRQCIYLYLACILTAAAEFCFTRYVSLQGQSNAIGHFFRLASYYFILKVYLSQIPRQHKALFRTFNPIAIYIALSASVIGLGGAYTAHDIEHSRHKNLHAAQHQAATAEIVSFINIMMQKHVTLAKSTEAFLYSHDPFEKVKFESFAQMMIREYPEVLGLLVKKAGTSSYVVNTLNTASLSPDLVDAYIQRMDNRLNTEVQSITFDGPKPLSPDVLGLTLIYPLPADVEEESTSQDAVMVLVDLLSVAAHPMFAGISNEFEIGTRFLSDTHQLLSPFVGDTSLFSDNAESIQTTISLGDRQLNIVLKHKDTEHLQHSSVLLSPWYWPVMLVIAAMSSVLLYRLINQHLDIQLVKKEMAVQHRHASYDELTGAFNRRFCLEVGESIFQSCRRESRPFMVLFMDLDGFKAVNDTYGHQAGDEVLVQTTKRIKAALRSTDIVARFGGDEFVALLRSADPNDLRCAKSIISAISEPFEIEGETISLGVSVGIASFPADADSLEKLLSAADNAMYAAKQKGKNRYKVYSALEDVREIVA